MGPSEKTQHAIRRSTRLPLEVPVVVTSLDAAAPFSEQCNTTLVNAHGCGLIVSRALATRHSSAAGNRFRKTAYHGAGGGGGSTGRRSRDLAGRPGTRRSRQLLGNRVRAFGLEDRGEDQPILACRGAAAADQAPGAAPKLARSRSLAPDRHQRWRLLSGDVRSISRRYSGTAQHSGVGYGVFTGRSGAGVARADGNGSRVHASGRARSPGASGGTHRPVDEQSRGSTNFCWPERRQTGAGETGAGRGAETNPPTRCWI